MALRSGHGINKGKPVIEVLPVDELPAGIAVPPPSELRTDRRKDGTFKPGNTLAAQGGLAKKGTTKLARMLGLTEGDARLQPYLRAARDFRRLQTTTLARTVGGGVCGPAPASIIATAALQLAASRYLFDHAHGDRDTLKTASALGNDSRQNLLAAHELCAKEAKARPAPAQQVPWLMAAGNDADQNDTQESEEKEGES
jgi:hypothetical protein